VLTSSATVRQCAITDHHFGEDSYAPLRTNSRSYPPLLACPKPFEKPFYFLEFKR
jgi:hypothetical protein